MSKGNPATGTFVGTLEPDPCYEDKTTMCSDAGSTPNKRM